MFVPIDDCIRWHDHGNSNGVIPTAPVAGALESRRSAGGMGDGFRLLRRWALIAALSSAQVIWMLLLR